ncbi:uncharacterized protein LOC107417350 [Ziziphus jujuba]|uniref:Uncharacterized protein LOC107417350 n=1 Tax=Ziziphus jujuba TaxID=326968 RepID=A0A6P3ZM58_ZIZJJ|nr:uncharacterized protein LOC107417350 [Ziziphus jujuba]
MNDSAGKTSSCLSLAVPEKRTHRPGGCVGIFFQLFDWNRRFAKKKLFSKKLLPPARAKQASKKFKGDEKMPTSKLHLIADENSGGFPNMKKHPNRSIDFDHKHEMRAPGLVARLMGLESMPALRDKSKKVNLSDACDNNGEKKCANTYSVVDGEDVNLERGSTKIESRPQKLQKTGQFERKVVTRFGAEALQIKNVLSRSRKHHHHPKLVPPVKSPRIPSGRNVSRTSRLIDAATKILEPATTKTKCAITYSNSTQYPPKNVVMKEATFVKSEELPKQPCYSANSTNCLMGKTSCKNCGNLLDVVDVGPNAAEQPSIFPSFASNFVDVPLEATGRSNPRTPIPSFGQQVDVVFPLNRDQPVSLPTQRKEEMDNRQWNGKSITERNSMPHDGQAPWQSSSQPSKLQSDERSSITVKHRAQIQDQMPLARGRTPSRSKLNNLQSRRASSAANAVRGTKDFVALNRSLSGRTRPRVPTKVEASKVDSDRKAIDSRDESPSQLRSSVRKRRTINASVQVESRGFVTSTATKQKNIQFDSQTGNGLGPDMQPMNRIGVRSRLADQRDDNRAKNKSTDVISFTFNSPMRHKTGVPMEVEEKTMGNEMKKFSQKPLSQKRDSIGALLEQKLKELTSQEDEELATGGPPKRSTAMILQELISALTSDHPEIVSPSIAETKFGRTARISHYGDHLSPGSVLDASFSSSSLDDSSGHGLQPHYVDCSDDHLHSLESDTDLLDSATSWDQERSIKRVTTLVSNISKILHSISIAGERLPENQLTYAKDAILNAEILFGDVAPNRGDGMKGLLVSPILLELETNANAIWTNMDITGLDATKVGNQCREFLFDCLIECIESRYSKCCNTGFRYWRRLPLCMTREMICQCVEEEIKKWSYLAGMVPDELIEWEMSHSLGKWTDFDIEAFECGAEIDGEILHILVDEIVRDLWECKQWSLQHFVQI